MVEMDLRQPYRAPCSHPHNARDGTLGLAHLKSQGKYKLRVEFIIEPYNAMHTHEVTYLPYGDRYKCNHANICDTQDCPFK